jgi:lyso-ornithine lipid O-acyltransferase
MPPRAAVLPSATPLSATPLRAAVPLAKPVRRFGAAQMVAGTAAVAAMLIPAELLLRRIRPNARPYLPRMFHRAWSRAMGVRIGVRGAPARRGGVLFVANHVSYLDVPVLGSRILGAFVAKSEVAGMGIFGWLAGIGRTIYIDRENRSRADAHSNLIADRLAAGGDVILFPEGTNSDGTRVLPFKSSLFSVVSGPENADYLIQPVTIAYTRVGGMPVTRGDLPEIAWVGDTQLVPHALEMLKQGRLRAEIMFHPAVRAADFADRKALAKHCHAVISTNYRILMRGHG